MLDLFSFAALGSDLMLWERKVLHRRAGDQDCPDYKFPKFTRGQQCLKCHLEEREREREGGDGTHINISSPDLINALCQS